MRRAIFVLRMQLQSIIRKPIWLVLLAISFVGGIGCYLFAFYQRESPMVLMSQTVFGQATLTLTFLMIGIEMQKEIRRDFVTDIISIYPRHTTLIPWLQIVTIGIMAVVVTIIYMFACTAILVFDHSSSAWILQTCLQIILLFFLPCFVMGVFGLLIGYCIVGKSVYFPAMLVWIATSSLRIYFTNSSISYLHDWRTFFSIINMGFNNFQMFQNVLSGAQIELPRWIVRIGILILLATLYIALYYQKHVITTPKSRIVWPVCVVTIFGFVLMSFLGSRYTVFFSEFADNTYTMELSLEKLKSYVTENTVGDSDFPIEKNITIKHTDIEMSCTTQGIEAKVIMTASMRTKSTGQSFTLYSGMNIEDIWVDGEPATFERSNDSIMVHFLEEKDVGETVVFTFFYHGYSLPIFPANESTVQLNRAFPWIPWPGLKVISTAELNNYSLSEVFFIDDWQRGDFVEYTLKYNGPGGIYTNLHEIESNIYKGVSDNGISLYSGMICANYKGIDVYVPASMYRYQTAAAEIISESYSYFQYYCELFNTPRQPEFPKEVVVNQMRYPLAGSVFITPNEVYTWNDEWEIRMRNESSKVLIMGKQIESSTVMSPSPSTLAASIAIPYIVNPSVGYPKEVKDSSTNCFVDFLHMSVIAPECDDNTLQHYSNMLKQVYSENDQSISAYIDELLHQMHSGENFNEQFKKIYTQLLCVENIEPKTMIKQLYDYTAE